MLAVITNQNTDTRSPKPVDLKGLWRRVGKGDNQAFEQVYRDCVGAVYGLCLRMTANPALAEECTQRTFVRAWSNVSKFRGDSKLTTWLHRIAVNEVLGNGRYETRYRTVIDEFGVDTEIRTAFSGSPDLDLESAIAQLPQRTREVFVLHGVYGYKHSETATMLGIATGTSKSHFHRARQMLQDALGDHHDPTG